jgi:hypothetical protein
VQRCQLGLQSLFQELNGFQGNDTIASGDDSYCKSDSAVSRSRSLCKIKSNIVTTKPLDDWKSLFYQRVRWASKTTYQSAFGQVLGLVVFGNLSIVVGYGLWIMGLCY